MPRKVAYNTLNATTLDILNVIRQNASYDYQQNVPEVTQATDIPKVGEVIYGTPAFANQFINALINRIALVRVQSATFNNPYSVLKKGYLEYGETVEDIFVNIVKAVDFTPEKGEEREFKRSLPDVRSAFHVMNWRVMYPVTIQDEDLKQAFLSLNGVTDLIAKIVEMVYTSAEYDEFLLFKYLLIKGIVKGAMHPVIVIPDPHELAIKFRGISNMLPFMSSEYNEANVKTTTPKDRQIIFMDAQFNAQFDVEVLASAFNMDKADFMGRLFLIDDWGSFDNERFDIIRENSDGLEEVTEDELRAMKSVKAVIIDENWFQVYDNNNKFTEKYVASGLYWNYFYHTWKTISYSPFANAVVILPEALMPDTFTMNVDSVSVSDTAKVYTFGEFTPGAGTPLPAKSQGDEPTANVYRSDYEFVQTVEFTEFGVAVQKYGAVIIPKKLADNTEEPLHIHVKIGEAEFSASFNTNVAAGYTLTFNRV